ncbi:MAG: NAD-dependent epimerase/dehydratase family protein [Kiritimatiellae bacterium]|nr:NAD-dependent epimerase/dehydratase family protein [Kiritimatiellia bacterium]
MLRTVLITGGSGFLGINLVRKLREKGVEKIRVLDIADFDYPEKDAPWLEFTKGDVRDLAAVEKCVSGCDAVVNTAAALPLYSPEDIRTTEVDGIRNVLAAAKKFQVLRIVQISSTAVYGVPKKHPIYETDELIGVGPYGHAKIEAEAVCRDARQNDGQVVCVIRPKSFIGPERLGVFALFYDWAYTGHGFPMIGSGNNRYQLMDVEDLCDALWNSLTYPDAAVNSEFNIGAKEFTTMKEDYQAVLDRAGHGKKIRGLPVKPIVLILRVLEKLHLSPLYPWVYETASTDSFVSVEKAEKMLDFKPRFSNKDALIRNYDWYVAHLDEFKGKTGVSHRVPWKQGLLAVAKWFF